MFGPDPVGAVPLPSPTFSLRCGDGQACAGGETMNANFLMKAGVALIGAVVLVVVIGWVGGWLYGDAPSSTPEQQAAVAPEPAPAPAPEPVAEPAPEPAPEPVAVPAPEPAPQPAVAAAGAAAEIGAELAALLAAADPAAANSVRIRCVACHTFGEGEAGRVGPNLWEIVGRPVAGVEGFQYSDALIEAGGAWTLDRLDAFLASPQDFARGTRMNYSGIPDAAMRANLVRYLRDLSNSPVPLPGG